MQASHQVKELRLKKGMAYLRLGTCRFSPFPLTGTLRILSTFDLWRIPALGMYVCMHACIHVLICFCTGTEPRTFPHDRQVFSHCAVLCPSFYSFLL